MPSTLIRTANPPQRRARTLLAMALLVVAVTGLLVSASRLVRGPRFVDQLTVRNPTGFVVDVSASDEQGNGTVPIAALEPHSTTVIESVIDPGDPWILDFRIAGRRVGTQRVSRAQLERDDWRVEIPDAIVTQIARRAP
jgi:hypothetical protein